MSIMRVRWGPQHPVSGQWAFWLDVDGDIVVNMEPDIGYTHRGIEKVAENRTYIQNVPVVERTSVFDAGNIVFGYVQAVEELMGIEIPERAKYIRTIVGEMSRIVSHLYGLGLLAIAVGFETMLMWFINDRELFLDLFEMLTGARITYSFFIPGGVLHDLPQGFYDEAMRRLDYFERRLKDYWKMFFLNRTFITRTRGVGVLKREDAIRLGVVGPNLRASGVEADVRKDEPYAAYDQIDFIIPTEKEGDAYARGGVRFHELEQSVSIIRQALQKIPDGKIRVKVPITPTPPKGEAYSRVETARGEIGYYIISDGSNRPYRVKISAPSFRNLLAMPFLSRNVPMADIPTIYLSLDLIPLDVDR